MAETTPRLTPPSDAGPTDGGAVGNECAAIPTFGPGAPEPSFTPDAELNAAEVHEPQPVADFAYLGLDEDEQSAQEQRTDGEQRWYEP